MLNLRKVAVTGVLSSGKSTVCQIFRELGAYVVSADEIVHKLLSMNTPLGNKIICLLGTDVIKNDKLDRQAIACKVFNNEPLLKAYESMIHPEVFLEINQQYAIAKKEHAPLFVAEVPLLKGYESHFDTIIQVTAHESLRKSRFKGSTLDFNRRMQRQQTKTISDFTIQNEGDLHSLQDNVKNIFHQLTQQQEFPPR